MRAWPLIAALVACHTPPRETPDGPPGGDDAAPGADADLGPCADAAAHRSYIGCSYWPVDLANAIEVIGPPTAGDCAEWGPAAKLLGTLDVCVQQDGTFAGGCDPDGTCATAAPNTACMKRETCGLDAQHSPFAIAVANTGAEAADVTLADASGSTMTITVAAGHTATLKPQEAGFADHSIEKPGIAPAAYHLTSTRPIVAYQLNPLDDVGVFSNDASLLLPEQTFDVNYTTLSFTNFVRRPAASDWRGYMTLVAAHDTTVDVTASTDVLAGSMTIPRGMTRSFPLHAFETLQLVAGSGDISGTRVTATVPLGAYGGHEATTIQDPFPFRGPCCADHLEEQLYPTSTLGKTYAIARGRVRATQIHDFVRVVAVKPNTVLQMTPQLSWGMSCAGMVLAVGATCDIYIEGDVELRSNEPILVGHYMVSGGGLGPQSGDPSLAYVPPVEQFRKQYTIVVPEQYAANDLQVVAPAGGGVMLDGADVTLLMAAFSSGTWNAARIAVAPGAHVVTCPMGCSVEVSGWDAAVSYLYSGGLDLAPLIL